MANNSQSQKRIVIGNIDLKTVNDGDSSQKMSNSGGADWKIANKS